MTTDDRLTKLVSSDPAFELVIQAAGPRFNDGHANRLAAIAANPSLEWDRVQGICRHNQVVPLVYDRLRTHCPSAVPDDVADAFRAQYQSNAIRNRYLLDELLGILDEFEARGIRAMPYKGPTLAQTSYGALTLRDFEDLDVFVSDEDLEAAVTVLEERGYEWLHEPVLRRESLLAGGPLVPPLSYEWKFVRPKDRLNVELKTRLHKSSAPIDLDFDALWHRGVHTSFRDGEATGFSPTDRLLVLAHHGYKHRWRQLKWICDVAMTIRAAGPFRWDHVLSRARAATVERRLLVALGLTVAMFDVPADRDVREAIQSDETAVGLINRILDHYRSDPQYVPRWRWNAWYAVYGTDTVRDAVVAATAPLQPDVDDYRFVPLPRWLFPMYYVVRPVRFAPFLGRTAIDRLTTVVARRL